MKKAFLLIILTLNIISISCQTEEDLSNIKGTEIFLFETECRNENSYAELKTKAEQKAFSKKYKTNNQIPKNRCLFYIDLENCKTKSEPFLSKADIQKFDWKNSEIVISASGVEKLRKLEVPLEGLPFVLKLNDKNIYAGWFWVVNSSFMCDRVWTYKNPKENTLNLKFGGFKCGKNPLTDKSLIEKAMKK